MQYYLRSDNAQCTINISTFMEISNLIALLKAVTFTGLSV